MPAWRQSHCAADPVPAGSLRQDFADPPALWKSRPLWFWNGPLDQATTTQIMEASVGSGYYGFGILPTEDMGVPFMSPEFLDHYRHAIDTAARLGLKMCLYDEFWFPSGSAGGLLKERYPEALSKRLDQVEINVVGPAAVDLEVPAGTLMAAVAMQSGHERARGSGGARPERSAGVAGTGGQLAGHAVSVRAGWSRRPGRLSRSGGRAEVCGAHVRQVLRGLSGPFRQDDRQCVLRRTYVPLGRRRSRLDARIQRTIHGEVRLQSGTRLSLPCGMTSAPTRRRLATGCSGCVPNCSPTVS